MGKVNTMGQLIRQYRKKRHLSQSEMSSRCGWGRSFTQRLENGDRFPDADTMIVIIQALDVPLSDVFSIYDKMPDAAFVSAKTTRELTKSIISDCFREKSDEIFDRSLQSAVPPYLREAIDGAHVGSYRSIIIDSIETNLFGHDELSRRSLKRLFDQTDSDYSIKRFMTDVFSGLAVIETGTLHRRTEENRVLVELAQKMAVGATPDGQNGDPSWSGPYIPWPLCSSLREIIDRLNRTKQHASDAIKINTWIPRKLQEMDISPEKFDFMHFNFSDSFAESEEMSYFHTVVSGLNMGFDVSLAVDFQRLYDAILSAWPYIYDMRDTYAVLMELSKLQPAKSYPDPTPDVMEMIRSAVKQSDASWRS
jgi:transcriptional regulator with XRE-family HTH domain